MEGVVAGVRWSYYGTKLRTKLDILWDSYGFRKLEWIVSEWPRYNFNSFFKKFVLVHKSTINFFKFILVA